MPQAAARRGLLDMDGYQWTVLFAAWLGESERRTLQLENGKFKMQVVRGGGAR